MQGLDSLDPSAFDEYTLDGPSYIHTLTIPAGVETTLTISFHLNDVQIGETAEIAVAPPPANKADTTSVYIALGCSAVVLIAGIMFFLRFRRSTHRREKKMMSLHMEVDAKRKTEAAELRMKAAVIEKEKEEEKARADTLRKKNENLQETLRKKKHSEKEMEAMKKAMDGQKEERKDELRTVLIPSSAIEIKELLGQGGMGKVHLANYKGQLVAVKQLITINDDSVTRFRRECFLTKELSHPNVVKFVGAIWDDMMLGCVLEYVTALPAKRAQRWLLTPTQVRLWRLAGGPAEEGLERGLRGQDHVEGGAAEVGHGGRAGLPVRARASEASAKERWCASEASTKKIVRERSEHKEDAAAPAPNAHREHKENTAAKRVR
jgi:hypothetical protein